VSFRAKRGSSQNLFEHTNNDARDVIVRATISDGSVVLPTIVRSRAPKAFGAWDDRSKRAAKVLEAIQTFFDYVEARGVAEPDRAVVAEGSPGNDGDAGFAQ